MTHHLQIKYKQLSPSNFRCGDVVAASNGEQYEITDATDGIATLRQLSKDERNNPESVQGNVELSIPIE